MVLVILFSLLPASAFIIQSLAAFPADDKTLHFTAYLMLGFLPALHERGRLTALLVLLTVLLGVLLELGQRWFSSRSFEVGDMMADGWGTVAGLVVGLVLRWSFRIKPATGKSA